MQKLTYAEYKDNDNILEIDLHNGYTIIAIKTWHKENHNYTVELFIKDNVINKWDLIEDTNSLEFNTNYKIINSAILKRVSDFLEEGFFTYYIQRYEYETKCFELGDEIYTKEGDYYKNVS